MNEETRAFLAQRVDPERVRALRERILAVEIDPDDEFLWEPIDPAECPRAPHRAPQGPNEDVAQCPKCWSLDFVLRPDGETFGDHAADCSLPRRHESYCQPGGSGHAPAEKIRGYWPAGT